jgi:hypothetical protein
MKKMKNILFKLSFAMVFLFISCSSDDEVLDTIAPGISILEPHDHEEFEPGETMHVEIIFTDNVQLASYKIDIHYAGDGHTHGVVPFSNSVEWTFVAEGVLTGNAYTLHADIEIPTMINGSPIKEGDYHFGVFALDAAGNETVVWIEIEVGDHHNNEPDPNAVVSRVELVNRSTGEEIAHTHGSGANMSWHGSFPHLHSGEEIAVNVIFYDMQNNPFVLTGDYEVQASLTENSPSGVVSLSNHTDHIDIEAISEGEVYIIFSLVHDGHTDFNAPSIKFEVDDH